ncbi:hypothetical protein BJG92_00752 [Arthrobacter sp. SO5]|uniref:hypothetical protein n=1 Tax=Arthrobacter sp. SO5 TaxID=1897055 RepID=UPI001E5F1B26|nr:hypothetical protein [Arthrobacter sp. SO5]MCB5273234.1 hypothetical protein [Arthrobacter sp. SO5]
MGELELAGIAARLYALAFDDFVAARTAAAKDATSAGTAADVRSLSKPSVAAWTVNMFAARHPDTLHELSALGESMRAAQSALDAAELRKLSHERRQLLSRAVKEAQAAAQQQGRRISAAIAAEVEETLRAATADAGAAAAVQSGRLLRALSADGVDALDLAGAVALPGLAVPSTAAPVPPDASGQLPSGSSPPDSAMATEKWEQPRLRAVRQEPRTATPSALERARAALQDAEQAARQAAEESGRHEEERAAAGKHAAGLAGAARTLREQLEQTELDLKSARQRQELAAAQAQQAVRASVRARRKADLARERVLRLGNTPE